MIRIPKEMIRISQFIYKQKDCSRKKDLSFQDKGSESLKGRSEDFGEKAKGSESWIKGFESPRRFMKQKAEKKKGFESPQEGSVSIIWENEEQSQGSESSQERFESIYQKLTTSSRQGRKI